MEEPRPIVYDSTHSAVMANDVIKGKQSMTLQEARLLRLVITQVAREDKDLKTYECKVKDLAKFMGISESNLYRDIRQICGQLAQRVVGIGTRNPKDPWMIFPWLQMSKYNGEGTVTLMLSEGIKPYVLELDKYFTQYRLENILEMTSFYAIRLYELLKADDFKVGQDYREYSIEYLRHFFDCEKKYPMFKDFRCRVIESSIMEINAKTDLEIRKILYTKTGRKVTGVRFLVWENHDVIKKRRQLPGQMGLDDAEES